MNSVNPLSPVVPYEGTRFLKSVTATPLHVREEVVVAARDLADLSGAARVRPDTHHPLLHLEDTLRWLRPHAHGLGHRAWGMGFDAEPRAMTGVPGFSTEYWEVGNIESEEIWSWILLVGRL